MDSISVSSQATCSIETEFHPEFKGQLDDTNLSPTDVFSGHYDYELFLLQKEIGAPHDNLNHHCFEEQDQDVILTHATILSHTFALPQFMDQLNDEDQEPTDNPIRVPTAFQVSCDHALHPECTHNLMATHCNEYLNLSHNSALPQFLAHLLKSKLSRTDRQTFRPRFRWEMLIHIYISPRHWKDASAEKRSLESDDLYVFLCLETQLYKYIYVIMDHWFFWITG